MPELIGARIAGVSASVWSETVDGMDELAYLVLPRLPVIAERCWSREVRSWADTRARVEAHRAGWEQRGLGAAYREV